ncbi:MAG: DoxX family protein [Bacteroidetes bacterium]|nr:DoxX family protein [Bacteroidota bacterium]
MKKLNIFYWICTGLLIPAIGVGSVMGIVPNEDSLKVFASLGYPAYIIPFLSVAKLLGLIVIFMPKYPRLKEWAYAGITFDVIGAGYSILAIGSPLTHVIFPALALLLLFGSYFLYHKKQALKAA